VTRRRALALLAVALVAAGAGLALRHLGVGRNLELETVDVRFGVRGPQPPPKDVVLVQVDERTLSAVGKHWPFPRRLDARVIDHLAKAGPRAIAIDLQFTEQTDVDDDNALIEAIDHAGHVVLATTATNDQGGTNVLGGDALLNEIGARVGSALLPLDADGALRRAAYSMEGLESFAVVATEVATDRQVDPFDPDRTWIRYAGPPQTLRSYSFSDVLRGSVPASAFRGKIVVVGTEALRLKDASETSTTANGTVMSGPEVQGNAIATVLAGLPLTSTGGAVGVALILLLGAVAPLAAVRLGALGATLATAVLAVGFAVVAQLLFGAGVIIPVVHPLAACAVGLVGVLAITRPRPATVAEPSAAATLAGDSQLDATVADDLAGFRLEEVVGRGGMGVVYRALQPGLNRRVAVKVIAPEHAADPGFRARFAREARLAAAIDHPNIVPVHMTGDDRGQLYLVMRYVEGVNLAERMGEGPIPRREIAEIVRQVASALDAAHEHDLIHRDVKPANILLVERDGAPPHVFLTDFGITRELGGAAGMTSTGVFVGSVDYAAPEQAEGAGPAADQYALACVAYELLAGAAPFGHGRDVAIRWAHLNEEPRPPSELVPGLPSPVDDAVLRALAKDPAQRWPSCTAFARRLSAALEGVGADQPLGT
jgi:CHASE2 domain-containing sensor protein